MRGSMSPPHGGARVPSAGAANRSAAGTDVRIRLQGLARRVRRLGLNGRFDPERAYMEREEVAHALFGLARELERSTTAPPAQLSSAAIPPDRTRRLEALLAGRQREIDRLRALLARAVRLSRRRRRAVSDAQLSLPVSETPV